MLSSPPTPGKHWSAFCHDGFVLLRFSCQGTRVLWDFGDWLLSLGAMPLRSTHEQSVSSHCWGGFQGVDVPQLLHPTTRCRSVGLVAIFINYEQNCQGLWHRFLREYVFLLGKLLHHLISRCFTSEEAAKPFGSQDIPFPFPTQCMRVLFVPVLASTWYRQLFLFYFSLPDSYVVVSHSGFNLHFPKSCWYWKTFWTSVHLLNVLLLKPFTHF